MKILIRTIILLVAPFQYSSANEMGASVDSFDWFRVIEVVMQFAIAACVLYLVCAKSYLKEKGKNLATKEDIKVITEQVERVKNSLLLSTQAKLNLHNEERDSLINSWEKINCWNSLIQNTYIESEFDTSENAKEVDVHLENARLGCEAAFDRACLFTKNEEFERTYYALYSSIIKVSHSLRPAILKNKHLQTTHQKWSPKYAEENFAIFKSIIESKVDERKVTLTLTIEFRNTIHEHLQGLANHNVES